MNQRKADSSLIDVPDFKSFELADWEVCNDVPTGFRWMTDSSFSRCQSKEEEYIHPALKNANKCHCTPAMPFSQP